MSRRPIFPNTLAGKQEFIDALERADLSGLGREAWFARNYQMERSTIHYTAKRLGVPLITKRSKQDRRNVLEAQREDLTPGYVVAYREDITVTTLRDWARREKLRLRDNTKIGHRRWWQRHLNSPSPSSESPITPMDVFEAALRLRVTLPMAIAGYHLAFSPEQALCWDLRTRQVVVWSEQDYLDGIATSIPATLEDAELVIGLGESVQGATWPSTSTSTPTTGFDITEPPLEREGHWPLSPGDEAVELNDAGVELRVTYLGLNDQGLARVRGASGRRKAIDPSNLYHPDEPALAREVAARRTNSVPDE